MKTDTLKKVCSLETKQECWTYDGQILLVNWQVAFSAVKTNSLLSNEHLRSHCLHWSHQRTYRSQRLNQAHLKKRVAGLGYERLGSIHKVTPD